MADPPNSLLDWLRYVPAEVREEFCSNLSVMERLAFVLDSIPIASDSPSYASRVNWVRHSFWASFLRDMRDDNELRITLGNLLKDVSIKIEQDNFVEHVSILDGLINQAKNATMIMVNREAPRPFSSNNASGIITIQSYKLLTILGSPTRLGFAHSLVDTPLTRVFGHFNVLKNVKHLELSNMTISNGNATKQQLIRSMFSFSDTLRYVGGRWVLSMSSDRLQFPKQLLHEAKAVRKITFSNVKFNESRVAKPKIAVDTVCIRNCTGTSKYIFSNIKAKSLEIYGCGVYFTWPYQQCSEIVTRREEISYMTLVDLKLHRSTQPPTFVDPQGFSLSPLKALKRASISVHYMSRVNLAGRLPPSLEVLEVRDCDPTVTTTGTRGSWIQDILYNESAPNLPNLCSIHVRFSKTLSQEAVRFHKFLQMQFVLEKDIAYRFSYG